MNIIVGYQEYLKRAEQTGLLDYYNIDIDLEKGMGTFCGKRKDRSQELKINFLLTEWMQTLASGEPMGLWKTKPYFMFRKCILAAGLRELFPSELGSMPYISEELWYQNKVNDEVVSQNLKLEGENE